MESSPISAGDNVDHEALQYLRKDFILEAGAYFASTGSANAQILAIDENDDDDHSGLISAIITGNQLKFKAGYTNTGAATMEIREADNVTVIKAATAIKDAAGNALTAGAIVAGQLYYIWYDGTNFRIVNITLDKASQAEAEAGTNDTKYMTPLKTLEQMQYLPASLPVAYTYTASGTYVKTFGGSTTQFDITNPGSSTFRYTYDTTGTDPLINTTNLKIGAKLNIAAQNFDSDNNGIFVVTGVGANYFEVTNASGVVESNKTIGTGSIEKMLSFIKVEAVGGGGGGGTYGGGTGGGGGGGGYGYHIIGASELGSTETVTIGAAGAAAGNGGNTSFGALLTANGGVGGNAGAGGTVTGADFSIVGGTGDEGWSGATLDIGGQGGNSFYGHGGHANLASTGNVGTGYGAGGSGGMNAVGGVGTIGIVIITEYYSITE